MVYVIWTDAALNDLREIMRYIAAQGSLPVAQKFCTDLYDSSDRLRQHPRSGQVVPEFKLEDLREIVFRGYRILYRCSADACYVQAVVHGSRDLQRHIDPETWDLR